MKQKALAGLALGLALLAAACGGSRRADEPGGARALEFVTADVKYVSAPAEAAAGEATFALENRDDLEHYVVIDEIGLEVEAHAGEAAEATTLLQPGTYTYYCKVPGHREAGMEGTLTVI